MVKLPSCELNHRLWQRRSSVLADKCSQAAQKISCRQGCHESLFVAERTQVSSMVPHFIMLSTVLMH